MNEKQVKLVLGCLLHDYGKILYRNNDGRNHSISGWENIKNIKSMSEQIEILNCIKYHHGKLLRNAEVENNDLCYIAYIADNIAAAVDRRENGDGEGGFVRNLPLESIFNILNCNSEKKKYLPKEPEKYMEINHPSDDEIPYSEEFYGKIIDNIKDSLMGIEIRPEYVNSLLEILRANLSYVPSSTNKNELADISLYDHLKLTAAFASCIKEYLDENGIEDYKRYLFENADEFYNINAFRIFSFDLSGIQDFIYNISRKWALKGLRARSFYLEIIMEHIIDELLEQLNLSRANILYSGGGHSYIIIPATNEAEKITTEFEKNLNKWFLDVFGNALYFATGQSDCSANMLKNKPEGSYKSIFDNISKLISKNKLNRYDANSIRMLNDSNSQEHNRECSVCHRSYRLNDENICSICSSLIKLSKMIINKNTDFFVVCRSDNYQVSELILPFNRYLIACKEEEIKELMNDKDKYVRCYTKNKMYTGLNISTAMWVGDYSSANEFSELIDNSQGIKRLAVLRADVDNLGQAFVNGFKREDGSGQYETITRTAVFSRKLSEFFKLHINYILENGKFNVTDKKTNRKRNISIVYSGGDDVFVIGAWDDVISFSVDLHNEFEKFTQGTLTLSAGIGIYPETYPIYSMALNSGELEELSKKYNNNTKNAVTLFDNTGTYNWNELVNDVILEKVVAINTFVENSKNSENEHNSKENNEKGKAMLYNMLELIRNYNENNDKLNIARFVYLLARLKPNDKQENKDKILYYNEFSKKMYDWIQNEHDRKSLITAIYMYVYLNRESEVN